MSKGPRDWNEEQPRDPCVEDPDESCNDGQFSERDD
jgi:hypothetical protein